MRKICIFLCICLVLTVAVPVAGLVRDRQFLKENVIRLHVVAHSDEERDQAVKLAVRDGVNEALAPALAALETADEARSYLRDHLEEIQAAAEAVLTSLGENREVRISLAEESFPTRQYDTFALPAGRYDALRITIGDGAGKNWWCVVFPGLCIPAASEGLEDAAAGAGFSQSLTGTLEQKEGYEIRFFFLECLGWIENFFFGK